MHLIPSAMRQLPGHRVFAALVCVILIGVLAAGTVHAQEHFGQPVPGQRVYDLAGVFSEEERAALEADASTVAEAGSPVVVYYRLEDADYDATVADGRELMDAWDIQSAPDARDGVVIFVNGEPDDPPHGQFAIIAGESLIDGDVPQYELERIADEMRDLLADERTVDGIALGLREVAKAASRNSPMTRQPVPSRSRTSSPSCSRSPSSPGSHGVSRNAAHRRNPTCWPPRQATCRPRRPGHWRPGRFPTSRCSARSSTSRAGERWSSSRKTRRVRRRSCGCSTAPVSAAKWKSASGHRLQRKPTPTG
jgi:uncharacterized membrane protein YgcG